MNGKGLFLTAALSLAVLTPALAQGGGGGGGAGGGASGGAAASSGAGTGTSASSSANGPSAPSGVGTRGTTTGVHTNTSATNPNVQPATPNGTAPSNMSGVQQTSPNNSAQQQQLTNSQNMTPADQARTGAKTLPSSETPGAVSAPGVGVGHAANGLPIGTPGTGTSNVDQK